jgi:pimeloyl-ACP methyl ester carboxylesterase
MATYVLVHGAWHGGWCWRRVASRLRAAGHEVYTPTLTGVGERVHLAGRDVSLSTHVADVANVLRFEDLSEVVLVGHSYARMVVTGVVAHMPERVKDLVYLDAFLPRPGQSLHDLVAPEAAAAQREAADQEGDGWRVPPFVSILGLTDPADLEWASPKLTPHPLATLSEKLDYSTPLEDQPFSRTYILATAPPRPHFAAIHASLEHHPAWRVEQIPTGHDIMLTRPDDLTAILLDLAAAPSVSR